MSDIFIEVQTVGIIHNEFNISESEQYFDFSIVANEAYVNCSKELFNDKH